MAWTTPRTWVDGEVVTAALMNAQMRDNLSYLYSNGWRVVYDQTLGSDTTFGSIAVPSTFDHLQVMLTGRGNAAVTSGGVTVRFNGDSGANYNTAVLRNINATPSGYSTIGATTCEGGILPGASATASYAGHAIWEILNYRGTTFYKTMQVRTGNPAGTAAQTYSQLHSVTWRSTEAITSFIADFNAIGTGWKAGTRLTVLALATTV